MHQLTQDRSTGIVIGLGLVGTLLTSWLVYPSSARAKPALYSLGVPACYLVVIGYLVATVAAWFKGTRLADALFYFGLTPVLAIGAILQRRRDLGTVECPRFEGLPMCFVSLLGGVLMLGLDLRGEWRRGSSPLTCR